MDKTELRVIIAGSRGFTDYDLLYEKCIDIIYKKVNDIRKPAIVRIISGTAQGADRLGEKFAESFHFLLSRFPAEWEKYGRRAGYIRNEQMAKFAAMDHTGMLIAFWNGKSKGTSHMIQLAGKYGLEVHVVRYEENL